MMHHWIEDWSKSTQSSKDFLTLKIKCLSSFFSVISAPDHMMFPNWGTSTILPGYEEDLLSEELIFFEVNINDPKNILLRMTLIQAVSMTQRSIIVHFINITDTILFQIINTMT